MVFLCFTTKPTTYGLMVSFCKINSLEIYVLMRKV